MTNDQKYYNQFVWFEDGKPVADDHPAMDRGYYYWPVKHSIYGPFDTRIEAVDDARQRGARMED